MQGENKLYKEKLKQISIQLPDVCLPFLLETGTSMAASTRYAYATELRWFFKYLIDESPAFSKIYDIVEISLEDLTQITSRDISKYLTIDKDSGKSEKTVARRRSAISKFFSYLIENRQIDYNPVQASSKVKVHKDSEVVYIDIVEQQKLLSSVDDGSMLDKRKQTYHDRYKKRDIALISLLLDTGIRISELHGMDIKDINFKACSVHILRKGGNKQFIYFSDEIAALLLDYLEERKRNHLYVSDDDPVFVTLKGQRLSIRAIQMLVEKYTESALPQKGKRITPHKLRSSFAMEYYDSTKDILALQKKLGHNSITTTNIYAKATNEKMKETRNVLENKRAGTKGEQEMKKKDALLDAMKILIGSGVMTVEEAAERLSISADELKKHL